MKINKTVLFDVEIVKFSFTHGLKSSFVHGQLVLTEDAVLCQKINCKKKHTKVLKSGLHFTIRLYTLTITNTVVSINFDTPTAFIQLN